MTTLSATASAVTNLVVPRIGEIFSAENLKLSFNTVFNADKDVKAKIIADLTNLSVTWCIPFTLFYVFVLPFSRKLFANGQHYQDNRQCWKSFILAYNYGMALFSLGCFVVTVQTFNAGFRPYTSERGCFNLFNDYGFTTVAYLFYASKYVEYFDTFFLYLMNKHVSWLQWYHHIGAAFTMFLISYYKTEATWIFVGFNSFIHTLMYLYFGLSVQPPNALKKFLPSLRPVMTTLQIVQFIVGNTLAAGYLILFPNCVSGDLNIRLAQYGVQQCFWYVLVVFLLFAHFFVSEYVLPAKQPSAKKTA